MQRPNKIPNATPQAIIPSSIAYNKDTKADVISKLSVNNYGAVYKAKGGWFQSFLDIDTGINARTEYTRKDYDYFRPSESLPHHQKQSIALCMKAYDKVGIIRNVIDLMGDFACQGIKIVHPNSKIQRFFRAWFEKVGGKERSERFLNLLYRTGNVIVKRQTGKLAQRDKERLERSYAKVDLDIEDDLPDISRGEIPWTYTFLNPLTVEVVGGELAKFVGKSKYALNVPPQLFKQLKNPSKDEAELLKLMSDDMLIAIRNNKLMIPLPDDKISVWHYKKDDWLAWANPMLYSLLDDLTMLEKLKLADISALDGIISNIRLWRLGSMEYELSPVADAFTTLSNILTNNVGGGTMDLIWGPDIDFKESATQAYHFLGQEKYGPVLNSIYAGLGIPPTLTGSATASGFTNNFISLKTLTERLQYGRDIITSFWKQELELVRRAFKFRLPADVHFDRMTLADEAAEKALLIQLADRDIISTETIQERFGELPGIEALRIKSEMRARASGKMPLKISSLSQPSIEFSKIALQSGIVTPSEIGMELEERKPGEKTPMEEKNAIQKLAIKSKPAVAPGGTSKKVKSKTKKPSGQGRPINSKDSRKRKQKRVIPRSKVKASQSLHLWAYDAQKNISDIVTPWFLTDKNKKNVRSLTVAETDELENLKFAILSHLTPGANVTSDDVIKLASDKVKVDVSVYKIYSEAAYEGQSVDSLRQLQILSLIESLQEEEDNG